MVLRATTLLAGVAGVVSALSTVTAPAVPKNFWLLQLGRECMDEDVRLFSVILLATGKHASHVSRTLYIQ